MTLDTTNWTEQFAVLQKQGTALEKRRARVNAEIDAANRQLKELTEEARLKYGVTTLAELQQLLADREANNAKLFRETQATLVEAEKTISALEKALGL